jgi:tRNA nucleotidyltransferase (CCA-adding enzyme)
MIMHLILCHTTADFDALAAAVGLTSLSPGAKIVLTGGSHPAVRDFLALHRDEYALIERRSVRPEQIRSITVVDTQKRDRIGKAAEWLDLPDLAEVVVYDHHQDIESDIPATSTYIDRVGATTTLIVEQLKQAEIQLSASEATVMALGIHVDTGSLTYEGTTARDAIALAWLMEQGASLSVIAQYAIPACLPNCRNYSLRRWTTCNQLLRTIKFPGCGCKLLTLCLDCQALPLDLLILPKVMLCCWQLRFQ